MLFPIILMLILQVQSWFKMEMYHPMIRTLPIQQWYCDVLALDRWSKSCGQLGDGTTTDDDTLVKSLLKM